ncbi:MAG TPA: flagellar hook assembly protein FlgD [Polyangiaceae bacterium]|nr:flagellar hook assembly protein FlgD [Polyangiaceae bacterium]
MVSPLLSSTQAQSAAESDPADALVSASNSSNAMGKDAFMKLLVAQISHQNPLKPMDDTAFVAQLAQFSALEQTMGINKRLDDLTTAQRGTANTELGALVGKKVTVRGTMTSLDSSGIGAPISFTLDGNAKTVDVNIADATGKTVRTIHVGAQAAGLTKITWDGRNNDGLAQPPGPYTVSVVAKDGDNAVSVSQETTGTLVGIDFSKGYPNLQLDNGVSAPASDLLRINLVTSK